MLLHITINRIAMYPFVTCSHVLLLIPVFFSEEYLIHLNRKRNMKLIRLRLSDIQGHLSFAKRLEIRPFFFLLSRHLIKE